MSSLFPHSRQGAEESIHVLIWTLPCSIRNDAFQSLGVRAGCNEIIQINAREGIAHLAWQPARLVLYRGL